MPPAFDIADFRRQLLSWFARHRRDLPWRKTKDPYAIWVSEIMLQQTRVAAAISYYERFLERFPGVESLAKACESDLLACWGGLGYYYRARNLQKAAQIICVRGAFPGTYSELHALPGIGDYTAAAIASICFDLPHPVLDGNVLRVLSRVFNDSTNIASSVGRKRFLSFAERVLDRGQPGTFNQAVMELGATVCLPRNPHCLLCPVAEHCGARVTGRQEILPVRLISKKNIQKKRTLYWIEQDGRLLLWQRDGSSKLMAGFWELPEPEHLPGVVAGPSLGSFRHTITVHDYRFDVAKAEAPGDTGVCQWITVEMLDRLPLSTIAKKARKIVLARRTARVLTAIV